MATYPTTLHAFKNKILVILGKPALVHGLEGHRISRVACGSSHSVCWTIPETPMTSCHEPVLFTAAKDPLGAGFVVGNLNNCGRRIDPSFDHHAVSEQDVLNGPSSDAMIGATGSAWGLNNHHRKSANNGSKASLSRIILSLESNASKQVFIE